MNGVYVGSENLVELSDTPKKAPSVPSDLSKIASSSGLSTPKGRGSMTRLPGPKSGRDSSSRESTPSNENLADTQKGKTKGIEKKVSDGAYVSHDKTKRVREKGLWWGIC